jgi:Trk K+ transport system NAD-binding subunit
VISGKRVTVGHIIVCGLGQVGYRIATLLLQMGESVHLVTQDARPGFIDEIREMGATVFLADARDQKSLVEADIASAKALIACTSVDLTNIEISLDARALRADIRIVARIFDQNLAQRLKDSVGIDETLAMSLLSAPKFASEALQDEVIGQFSWNAADYSLVRGEHTGSRVILEGIGTATIRSLDTQAKFYKPRKQFRKQLRVFWTSVPRSLKVLSLILVALFLVSVLVFTLAMRLSLIDSIYFVITTLTTTGYGDITVKEQAVWIKLYACWMMLLGSAAVATLYSIITDYIVSTRFSDILGSRSVDMKDHVIVVGIGNVGFRICQSLHSAGVPVIAIDSNTTSPFRGLLPDGIPFLIGDGREPETLRRASVEQSQALISTTNDDAVNLSVGLAAKSVNAKARTILRLFDPNFAHKVETTLDIDRALSASMLSAPGFVAAALFPNAVFSFATKDRIYVLEREQNLFVARSMKLLK